MSDEYDAYLLWKLSAQQQIDNFREETKALRAENAKLRELIADVHDALCADKAGVFHRLTLASMEDEMRELGIEEG